MSKKQYKIAVVGATGNVGKEILTILHEEGFDAKNIRAVASSNSIGKRVSFGDEASIIVDGLDDYDFSDVDFALFSPGASISKEYAPKAASQGAIVIDNTSYFRMHDDIPLIVPEVNGSELNNHANLGIISNPNCSTIQMLLALKPLHNLAQIKRVVVATYQAVSGAGKAAMDELFEQTKSKLLFQDFEPQSFTRQIAFNAIPHIDVIMEDGVTKEEWKMAVETKKIMGDDIAVTATCVRIPVFIGHSEAVNIEFANEINIDDAVNALENFPGVAVQKTQDDYITPVESVSRNEVFVSRIRRDPTIANGLNMWVVSDNVRKGAALNAVQIMQYLIKQGRV